MERGIYFDGWFPNHYCYHPSMSPRRLSMIDDLEDMGGTILVWAGLGGGSISLPYLEEEAFGSIPARFRQYGFVNDSEFIAHAKARGIDLFAIVFEAQAWEFPAEIVDGEVVAQNELRGVAEPTTVGLREFSQDSGPASWKPFGHYFPDSLTNSAGERVTDLWEEVVSRDLEGNPYHAHWVEVDGKGQNCYLADRNNPVWREYLKAIIRIQIDAGAPGIQLDETDTPMLAFRYGGCFCKDCVAEFRSYLKSLPASALPVELVGIDLDAFDYRQWLLERGHRSGENPQGFPLYQLYSRAFQVTIPRTFRELAEYAHQYAQSKGRTVRVAGNFYDVAPYYDPMIDDVDVLVTEMRETRYQQPWYFRHGVGLSRGKPLVAVENPYGGNTAELLEQLKAGRGYDLFALSIYEASAMGANMSLPYGSWLGTEVKDSYWAPRDLAVKVGQFVKSIDPFISQKSRATTAVLYSIRSMIAAQIDSDQFSDQGRWYPPIERSAEEAIRTSYWETVEALSRASRTFDAVILPDEELRPNDLSAESLARYETIVLPSLFAVSPAQNDAIAAYLDQGGRAVVHGEYGAELRHGEAQRVLGHPSTTVVGIVEEIAAAVTDVVDVDLGPLGAVGVHSLADGSVAVHLLNYDYDAAADAVRVRTDVPVKVQLGDAFQSASVITPEHGEREVHLQKTDDGWSVTVPALGTYAVVRLAAA
jgi:hypothetical protein